MSGTRQCENVGAQSQKQYKQQGHHDLIRFFDSACDSISHDHARHDHSDHLPKVISEGRCRSSEESADCIHILPHPVQPACDCKERVFKDPSYDHRISDRQCQRAKNRNHADHLTRPLISGADLRTFAKCPDRSALCRASKCHFLNHAGRCN